MSADMGSSKNKSIMRVVEGFALLVTSHWIATNYLTSTLVEIAPGLPWATAGWIAGTLSPIIASAYMMLRMRYIPRLFVKTQMLGAVIAGIIFAWLILFVQALFLGKRIPLAQEMLQAQPPYFHVMLFLLIVWGPLWEETLHRGYFFETLKQTCGNSLALLISSFLFVAFHAMFNLIYNGSIGYDLVFMFVASMVFTLSYVRGGLTAAVITHGFANFYLAYLNM